MPHQNEPASSSVLPPSNNWPIQRPKATTPPNDANLSSGSSFQISEDGQELGLERGRKRLSEYAPSRRDRRHTVSLRPPSLEPTKAEGAVLIGTPTSATSRDSELDLKVMEPLTQEHVSATLAERIDDRTPSPTASATAGSTSKSRSLDSWSKHEAVAAKDSKRRSPATALSFAGTPPHRTSDPYQPGWGFDTPSSIHRVSSPPAPSPSLSRTRDTFALLQQKSPSRLRIYPRGPSIASTGFEDLPFPAMLELANLLDHQSYLAARLTCQSWHIALTHVRPPVFPPLFRLPVEIVQAIYKYLHDPRDFDAARHTCRAWMAASLEGWVLERMFRKGGWWVSWVDEKARRSSSGASGDKSQDDVNDIWAMSRILSRECCLAGSATRAAGPEDGADTMPGQFDGNDDREGAFSAVQDPFELTLKTDFTELSDAYTWVFSVGVWSRVEPEKCCGLRFTPSVCNRFVMVVDGYRIFVYRLGRGPALRPDPRTGLPRETHPTSPSQAALHPVSSVVCPRRVLAVSMDSSAGRFAVAVLMDDRMGLVCDLSAPGLTRRDSFEQRRPTESYGHPEEALVEENAYWSAYPMIRPYAPAPRYYQTAPTSILFGDDSPAVPTQNGAYRSTGNLSVYSSSRPCPMHVPIASETGPRTVYRAVGAADDPPLSVAICPQRRCVAFGCAAGIELHWVDALTGHDLNRWFPLAAPSDYLFFLPPRPGVDGARKLRLVSSTRLPDHPPSAGPSTASATAGVPEGRHDRARAAADTFRAIPLSDGVHVVFTDPVTGSLCIGTDAPNGLPCRLSRKVVLESPPNATATTYAVGRDLQWGARVVAAYGNDLLFYSVPADVLRCEDDGSTAPWADTYGSANSTTTDPTSPLGVYNSAVESTEANPVWPVHIRGVRIAEVSRLAELAIDSRQATLTIWAFARDGMARAWQVRRAEPRAVRVGAVRRDGSIGELEALQQAQRPAAWTCSSEGSRLDFERDEDGDAIMLDAPPMPAPPPPRDPGIFEPRLHPLLRRQLDVDGARSPLAVADTPVLDARCQSLCGIAAAATGKSRCSNTVRPSTPVTASPTSPMDSPYECEVSKDPARTDFKPAGATGTRPAVADISHHGRTRGATPNRTHQILPELFSLSQHDDERGREDGVPAEAGTQFINYGHVSRIATHVLPGHGHQRAQLDVLPLATEGPAGDTTTETTIAQVGGSEARLEQGNDSSQTKQGSNEAHWSNSRLGRDRSIDWHGFANAAWNVGCLEVEIMAA